MQQRVNYYCSHSPCAAAEIETLFYYLLFQEKFSTSRFFYFILFYFTLFCFVQACSVRVRIFWECYGFWKEIRLFRKLMKQGHSQHNRQWNVAFCIHIQCITYGCMNFYSLPLLALFSPFCFIRFPPIHFFPPPPPLSNSMRAFFFSIPIPMIGRFLYLDFFLFIFNIRFV